MTDFRGPHPFLVVGVYFPLSAFLVGTFAPSGMGRGLTTALVVTVLLVLTLVPGVVGMLLQHGDADAAED